ncbi:YtpI family protein [Bacillus sp. FJAT-50079]|uniref:YtpI family protein n=1 Tax=Bacillus sp. FJAT-50079 TaxID=2833577 RepID=UPI001BCA4C7C|nr:YtpI family protein [Bacillus sp. FJAT-50079]MBS4208777.1 YtpI family protein [Bacillus sp. FJAT-50079]
MPFLVFLIVISFSFYVFYKVKYVRSRMPMERKMLNGKSSVALGLFVALFGLNQFFMFSTVTTYIIGGIFILLGCLSAWNGYRIYRHHVPYAIKEAEEAIK